MFASSGLAARFGGGLHGSASRYELPPTSSSPLVDDAISLPSSSYNEAQAGPSRLGLGLDVAPKQASTLEPRGGQNRRKYTPHLTPIMTGRNPRSVAAAEHHSYDNSGVHAAAGAASNAAGSHTQISNDTAYAQGDAYNQHQPPPTIPVKPYPPKLNDALPHTPFAVTFGIADASPEHRRHLTNIKRQSPIAQRRVLPARDNKQGSQRDIAPETSLRPLTGTESILGSRDSTYTTSSDIGAASAVVSTANAISLQRAVASPRLFAEAGSVAIPIAMSSATSSPPAQQRVPLRVDKSVGVSTRRRVRNDAATSSQEGASQRNRRNSTLSQLPSSPISPYLSPPRADLVAASGMAAKPSMPDESSSRVGRPSISQVPATAVALQDLSASSASQLITAQRRNIQRANKPAAINTSAVPKPARAKDDSSSSALHSPWLEQDSVGATSMSSDAPLTGQETLSRQMSWRTISNANAETWAISDASIALHDDSWASLGTMSGSALGRYGVLDEKDTSPAYLSDKKPARMQPDVKLSDASTQNDAYSIKDTLLRQLMASVALVDAQACPQFNTLEEVEQCKIDIKKLEQRAIDLRNKLKVYMRVRDAAHKLRRAALQGSSASASSPRSAVTPTDESRLQRRLHQRHASSASSTYAAGSSDLHKAESDALAATRGADAVTRELFAVQQKLSEHREKLLQHSASVLAVRVESLEDESTNWSRYTQESTVATTDEEDDVVFNKQRAQDVAQAAVDREELQQMRARVAQLEDELKQKTSAHAQDFTAVRSREDDSKAKLEKEHQLAMTRVMADHTRMIQDYERRLKTESTRATTLARDLDQHRDLVSDVKQSHAASQERVRALEVEANAQRSLMQENHQFVRACESRLEKVEACLREENDRCARMLGKVDGREEMDDLLSRIKAGGSPSFDNRQKKTAGQDIDELVDTLSTHLHDLEDELHRAQTMRMRDTNASNSMAASPVFETTPHHAALREMGLTLQDAQREAMEWRAQAETASRKLEAMQRHSAVSLTSSAAVGQQRLSTRFSSSINPRDRLNSIVGARRPSAKSITPGQHSVAELEARIALLEKRNEVLESELSSVGASHSRGVAQKASADGDVHDNLIHELLRLLPRLDGDVMDDLHEVQEYLENMTIDDVDRLREKPAQQLCMLVMDRTRSLVSMSRTLVGKALALEMQGRDLEEEVMSAEDRCEELQSALESLRASLSEQMQASEAAKKKERQLEQTIAELEHVRDEAVQRAATQRESPTHGRLAELPSTPWRKGRQLSVSSAAGKMVKSSSFGRQLNMLQKSPQRVLAISLSPTPSKISFTASGASTPATSLPTSYMPWSSTAAAPESARWPSSRSRMATSPAPASSYSQAQAQATRGPRTMTLGLSNVQLTQRVRELEDALLKNKAHGTSSNATPSAMSSAERSALVEQLDAANARLDENQREVEDLRNIESRQRIALLEEMTTLTADLSAARAELRRCGASA